VWLGVVSHTEAMP